VPGSREPERVVCAPDKLRGALSAPAAAAALARGVVDAGLVAVEAPVADGGEGTLDALVAGGRGSRIACDARDPLSRWRTVAVGDLGDGVMVVEAAQAIALASLAPRERDPMRTSSAGVGDLLLVCLEAGARRILVGLGGSATVDGGLGMLAALGGRVPGATGAALLRDDDLAFDLEPARRRLRAVRLEVLHDVDVPLTGEDGAARLFGPQKGLAPADVPRMDAALGRLGTRLGGGVAEQPGAGAAGGLGAALYALGASGRAGADVVLEMIGLERMLAGASLCLTAEGRVDRGSARGKAVAAVTRAAVAARVPCDVLAGAVDPEGAAALVALGARRVTPLGPPGRPLADALAATADELRMRAREACG
jgi:glycerate 2-kinase